MTAKIIHPKTQGLLLLTLLVLFFLPMPLLAGEPLISGRYLSGAGQDIQLQITVASPAPGTLIVIQKLQAGTVVEAATPAFHQYDAGKGEGKWLLTQIRPGRHVLSLRLAQPVAAGTISGEIRL